MDERRTVRQLLLNCLKLIQESIFGDLIGKDVDTANCLAKGRIEWKKNSCRVVRENGELCLFTEPLVRSATYTIL